MGITMFGPFTPIYVIGLVIVLGVVGFKMIDTFKPSNK